MTFPVVSADSDHRLLSGNPSGCWGQSTIWMPINGAFWCASFSFPGV